MTTPETAAGEAESITSYGLRRPVVADVGTALRRIYSDGATPLWADLLARTSLRGNEGDRPSLELVLGAMSRSSDPIVQLCGHSIELRLASYDHLSIAYAAVRSARQ